MARPAATARTTALAVPTRVVGLAYDPEGDALPRVVLKAAGPLAGELLSQPRLPPVRHDAALLDALFRLPTDGAIGPDLFHAVAAILAHVIAVDARRQEDA
jgi:flagellar biosynthesis protein